MQFSFFYHWRFSKKLADNQSSSITKYIIYHIRLMFIQPFITRVDWPGIEGLMEVSNLLCLIFAHTAFLLCRANYKQSFAKYIWALFLFSSKWTCSEANNVGAILSEHLHLCNTIRPTTLKIAYGKRGAFLHGTCPNNFDCSSIETVEFSRFRKIHLI